jgi:hypothetical protein
MSNYISLALLFFLPLSGDLLADNTVHINLNDSSAGYYVTINKNISNKLDVITKNLRKALENTVREIKAAPESSGSEFCTFFGKNVGEFRISKLIEDKSRVEDGCNEAFSYDYDGTNIQGNCEEFFSKLNDLISRTCKSP